MSSPYLPNTATVLIGRIPYVLKLKPAKTHKKFMREFKHCRDGEEGECGSCANALAGMDAGIAPYCISLDSKFIGVEKFKRTRKGVYGIGTIWESNQSRFQKKFDPDKPALLQSQDAVGEVRLYPYRKQRNHGSGPSGKHTGKRSRPVKIPGNRRGALRRAKRAGILP